MLFECPECNSDDLVEEDNGIRCLGCESLFSLDSTSDEPELIEQDDDEEDFSW